jgi:hypothetical protein
MGSVLALVWAAGHAPDGLYHHCPATGGNIA